MPITSRILLTVDNPIPTWKGTECLPDVLVISADPPPISGSPVAPELDFHCADTFGVDGGIIESEKVDGTIFDDQE